MIIKISYPSRIKLRFLRRKTREFQRFVVSNYSASALEDTENRKIQILLRKRSILLHFEPTDSTAISILRDYVSFVFKDSLIGVEQHNPITGNLDGVNVFLFSEGRM